MKTGSSATSRQLPVMVQPERYNFMPLRSTITSVTLASALSLSFSSNAHGSEDAMIELFKILRDRGSISDAEYQKLSELAKKGQESKTTNTAGAGAESTTNKRAAVLEDLDQLEKRLAAGEERLAQMEQRVSSKAKTEKGFDIKPVSQWFEKLKIDGYTQLRTTWLLNDKADSLHVPADRSVDEDESLIIRRGRFKISGHVTEHLYLYSQFDFAGSVFGSGGSFGLQARDLYADYSFDKEHVYRLRLGLSKVPYGWVNMQSSQNRGPMERPDALNSAVEGERDQAVYFMYTPPHVRERFKELANVNLKGSGDYGMFTVGVFGGQGLNRSDKNGEPHVLARLTYPWKLPNGQFIETAVNAYHGKFVVGTDEIDVNGNTFEPFSSDGGVTDQRIGVSAILYPQPFGLEAEWNWGRGPQLSDDLSKVETGFLHGGYVQANYLVKTSVGRFFPFLRWNYYDGARKFANNAPRDRVNEIDFGFEWSPRPEIELSLMYTHTFKRTDTTSYPYDDVTDADRIGFQFQWNY